jgi:hypothetical protein
MAGPWEKYAQPQGVQLKPADPLIPGKAVEQQQNITQGGYQIERAAAEAPYVAPKAAADVRNAQTSATVNAAKAPAEIETANNKARQARVEADTAEITKGAGADQGKAASFYTRALESNSVYDGLKVGAPSAGREIAKSILPGMVVNHFTDSSRQQAEAAERNFIAATLRYESGAALPPSEFVSQRKTFFPEPGDSPETIALKERFRKNAIDGLRISAGPAALNVSQPGALESATQEGRYYAPPKIEAATDRVTTEMDPQMAAAVDRMIRAKRPPNEIVAYAKSKGANTLNPNAIAEAQQYLASNPGYKGSFATATKQRPTTTLESLAASPLSAFVNGAGTAVTAGFNDELVGAGSALLGGDYEQGRDAFNAKKFLVADENPVSDFAGNVLGSALSMGGLGAGATALAANGSRAGGLLMRGGGLGADATYGALFGAGQNNENRMGGSITGLAAAGLGNIAGQGLASGVAGAIAPNGGRMANMYALGARPSIGQRMGGIVNSAEEKLQSLPLVGDAIRGTRDRARDQAERGIFNDALGQVGERLPDDVPLGTEAHTYKQGVENRVYSQARAGMNFVPDGQFGQDLGQLQRQVGTLADNSQTRFARIWEDAVVRRLRNNGGRLSGDAYKDAHSDIGDAIRGIRKSPNGDGELADALEAMQSTLDGAARRNSPPEANALMDQADAMYARGVLIDRASSLAGGEPGRMSPSQYARAVKGEAGGVRGRQFNAGNALNQDLATSFAQLGDAVPNSGTFDRAAMTLGAGGLGLLEPTTATALGGLGLLNLPGVRNLTTGLMAPRGGPLAQGAADQVRRLRGPFASLGAGAGIALTAPR